MVPVSTRLRARVHGLHRGSYELLPVLRPYGMRRQAVHTVVECMLGPYLANLCGVRATLSCPVGFPRPLQPAQTLVSEPVQLNASRPGTTVFMKHERGRVT